MASNPLHELIDTLGKFIDVVWACHHASTEEARRQPQDAWMEEKAWFWPRFRFPAEAERGLADPAIAWWKDKGLPIEKYADTIESGAHAITVLAMTTVPCALPSVYAN